MKRKYLVYILLFLILLSISCSTFMGMIATPTPTHIPTDTVTPTFTETPTLTFTLPPTLTPTPIATATPTLRPSPTPVSYGAGKLVYWVQQENYTGDPDFDSAFYSIGILNLETGEQSILLESDGETYSLYVSSASSDGRYIYFMGSDVYEADGGLFTNSLLYVYDLGVGNIDQISVMPEYSGQQPIEELLNEGWPDISPDGRYLVFGSNRDHLDSEEYIENLYLMDVDDHSIEKVPGTQDNSLRARFSPDGTRIAYSFWDGDDWEIYVIGVDGSGGMQITDNEANDRYPEWSPAGDELVFHSNMEGSYDLFIYDFDSGETSRLTSSSSDEVTASYSPNGDYLVYMVSDGGQFNIYVYSFATGEERLLIDLDEMVGVPIWVP